MGDASPLVGTFSLNDNAAYQHLTADPNLGTLVLRSWVPLANGMQYRLSANGSGWSSWTPLPSYYPAYEINMPSGMYTFQVEYTDGVRTLVLEDAIIVDADPPTAPAVTAKATSTDAIKISWSGATDVGTGITAYRVYLDGDLAGTLGPNAERVRGAGHNFQPAHGQLTAATRRRHLEGISRQGSKAESGTIPRVTNCGKMSPAT